MKARLIFAALCIVALPVLFSPKQRVATPFTGTALAGRVLADGAYCECGSSADCICDPGEVPTGGQHLSYRPGDTSDNELDGQTPPKDVDLSPGTLLLAFAFLLWLRMR